MRRKGVKSIMVVKKMIGSLETEYVDDGDELTSNTTVLHNRKRTFIHLFLTHAC